MRTYPLPQDPDPLADTQPFAPVSADGAAWLLRLLVLGFSGGLLLLTLLAMLWLAFQIGTRGRILPNVSAMGVSLAGMTPGAAVETLRAHFTFPRDAVITLRDPADAGRFWSLSAADLGVAFDAESTAAEAFAIGRGRGMAQDSADQALAWLNGYDAAPVVRYDQAAALAHLSRIAADIDRPARDAQLVIDGLTIATTPAEAGRALDVAATLNAIETRLLAFEGGEIALVINERPPLAPDPTAAADRLRAAISTPITLTATAPDGAPVGPWTISRESIAALLTVEMARAADGQLGYNVTASAEPLRTYLEALAPGLLAPGRDARYDFDPAARTLLVAQPSQPSRQLDVAATLAAVEAVLFDPNPLARTVPLVFAEVPAQFHDAVNAADLGIIELVARGESRFAGSTEARIRNIEQSAARFDGLIVRPGETFSFNYHVGDISPEAGYEEAFVIVGGRTVRGVGGGVCQVSTTAFRAAFYAGYAITERYAHGYRVGFYEDDPGMDAAIFTPDLDFRFINNTPHHLLITTEVDRATSTVAFNFYSTLPDFRVTREPAVIRDVVPALPTVYEVNPAFTAGQIMQTDWAAEGAYIAVTRVFTDLGGNELRRETFAAQYQPWAAVVQVPPGDPRASR
jgi:vancomycin resistance protein YoaR